MRVSPFLFCAFAQYQMYNLNKGPDYIHVIAVALSGMSFFSQMDTDALVYGMDAAYHPQTYKASVCKTAIHFILSKAVQSN